MSGNIIPFEKIDPSTVWFMNVRAACHPDPDRRARAYRRHDRVTLVARPLRREVDALPDWMQYNAFVIATITTEDRSTGDKVTRRYYSRFITQSRFSRDRALVMIWTAPPAQGGKHELRLVDMDAIEPPAAGLSAPPPLRDERLTIRGESGKWSALVRWQEWAGGNNDK